MVALIIDISSTLQELDCPLKGVLRTVKARWKQRFEALRQDSVSGLESVSVVCTLQRIPLAYCFGLPGHQQTKFPSGTLRAVPAFAVSGQAGTMSR